MSLKHIQVRIVDDKMVNYIPQRSTLGSAGMDLRACILGSIKLQPNETRPISTGLEIYIKDPGYVGLVVPRSGLGHRHGIVLGNLVGVIDSDYQGVLTVSCWNRSDAPYIIHHGDRIAQLLIVPVEQAILEVVDEFDNTSDRGMGGFGSTGV